MPGDKFLGQRVSKTSARNLYVFFLEQILISALVFLQDGSSSNLVNIVYSCTVFKSTGVNICALCLG